MTKEEILTLLKRKCEEYREMSDKAIKQNDHNSQCLSSWYDGKASAMMYAISVIGMLDKPNNNTNIC